MNLSIASITTTCLLNSLLILGICFLARRDNVIRRIGPGCMIILMLAMIIRMFLPFEFPYTYNIRVEDTLSPVMRFFRQPVFSGGIKIMMWDILMAVWGIGAVWGFVCSIWRYQKILHYTVLLPEENWETALEKYHLDREAFKGIEKVKLAYSKDFQSPCIVGICHPCLILPKENYKESQFYYIIQHELMHVKNKDIVWKVFIDLLCITFWWNPVFRYLKKELFQLIEMRNDMKITSEMSEEEIVGYMESLRDTAIQMAGKEYAFCVSFNRSKNTELIRRMKLLKNKKFCCWQQAGLYLLSFILLFLTSTIIIEPYSLERVEEGVVLTLDNTYLIRNGKQYDVYVYEEYLMTVDDLRGFDSVNIYDNLEEARENE